MTHPESGWSEKHSQLFADHDKTLRGHVRYEVTRHNLIKTLGEFLNTPRMVADIGGGQGRDAKWLAQVSAGHQVYLFEPDRSSVAKAEADNDGRIAVVNGDAQTALESFGSAAFDLVLSHGVLQYLPDPQAELERLAVLIKPGGYLSTLNAGILGKLNRYHDLNDQAMVDRLRLSGKFYNRLNVDARAFLPQEMTVRLEAAGFEVADWFGVRILSDEDPRLLDDVAAFHRNRLISSEIEASADPTLRPGGQLLHHIARRT